MLCHVWVKKRDESSRVGTASGSGSMNQGGICNRWEDALLPVQRLWRLNQIAQTKT